MLNRGGRLQKSTPVGKTIGGHIDDTHQQGPFPWGIAKVPKLPESLIIATSHLDFSSLEVGNTGIKFGDCARHHVKRMHTKIALRELFH
jgi:hypothetical protein